MDQIFTRDTIQMRAILEAICGHLPIEDLLQLERVSPLAGDAVRDHHYERWITIRTNYVVNTPTGKLLSKDFFTFSGPITPCVRFKICLNRRDNLKFLVLLLLAFRLKTPHLKRLQLAVCGFMDPLRQEDVTILNQHANQVLDGITFHDCAVLILDFSELHIHPHHTQPSACIIMPHFLERFPAVVDLTLKGTYLPLLCYLAGPQIVCKLDLHLVGPESEILEATPPVEVNFSGLESLTYTEINFQENFLAPYPLSQDNEHLNSMTLQTGIRWLTSLRINPPTHLRDVTSYQLTDWMIAVLAICAPHMTCWVSLKVKSNESSNIQQLIMKVGRRELRNITHLQVEFCSEQTICHLLALTSSLQELRLWVSGWIWDKTEHELQHRLPSLNKLMIDDYDRRMRPDWLESVRRNASHDLEIVTSVKLR